MSVGGAKVEEANAHKGCNLHGVRDLEVGSTMGEERREVNGEETDQRIHHAASSVRERDNYT